MSILEWFAKKQKNVTHSEKLNIPGDLWIKCPTCGNVIFSKDLEASLKVCSKCCHHFRITPDERVSYFFDPGTFIEIDSHIKPIDFLKFTDTESYAVRIQKTQKKHKRNEAMMIGEARLSGMAVNVGIMDFGFMGGSMGSVVGEKIARIIEKSIQDKYPLILFTSSGGARMQEGITSLMQMAKTSAALSKLADVHVPYISVLCDPTTGGTSASFAMLGDIHIAEPNALISFAGPRVIEQTIRQKIPKGFQRSEFLLAHGMVDMVVERKNLQQILVDVVSILDPKNVEN